MRIVSEYVALIHKVTNINPGKRQHLGSEGPRRCITDTVFFRYFINEMSKYSL